MPFVYAIAYSGDKFVMVRNRNRGWEMPGGDVEPGETPEDAIEREFEEETGMEIEIVSCADLPGGRAFFGVVGTDSGTSDSSERKISEDAIAEVSFFRELPEGLSFSRKEYETMLQESRIVLKKYINRNSIGDDCAT